MQAVMLDIAHHTDHFNPGHIPLAELDAFAERLLSRPEPPRHRFIDDDDRRRIIRITLGKGTSFDKRDAHRLKIVRIDNVDAGHDLFAWRWPMAFDRYHHR